MEASNEYFSVVINRIYNTLKNMYVDNLDGIYESFKYYEKYYPRMVAQFREWIERYWSLNNRLNCNLNNAIIFDLNEKDYSKAIIEFIAGMTDNFAMDVYNEIVRF
jgi:dGTPase